VQANRLASVAHDGLARAIWPVHTQNDGDVVFALATGAIAGTAGDGSAYRSIEAMAVLAVERAIVRAVRRATSLAGVRAVAELQAGP
jgi:L-aminopeptidase/D-esterase-like protein